MSYSFSVRAPNKAAAKAAVALAMAKAATGQACHARDLVAAVKAGEAFIDQLADDPDRDVAVNMSGSLMGRWDGSDVVHCESANVNVTASLVARPPAA
jgi:hypothetical protein